PTLISRAGDPAPGTDASFHSYNQSFCFVNDAGRVLVTASLTGGSASDSSNNNGYWTGTPGALVKVARAGEPAPGTAGATFSSLIGKPALFNDLGQVVFSTDLVGGDVITGFNDRVLYAWDPVKGLFLLARSGEDLPIPNVFLTPFAYGSMLQF